jgi:hypothetical protein
MKRKMKRVKRHGVYDYTHRRNSERAWNPFRDFANLSRWVHEHGGIPPVVTISSEDEARRFFGS